MSTRGIDPQEPLLLTAEAHEDPSLEFKYFSLPFSCIVGWLFITECNDSNEIFSGSACSDCEKYKTEVTNLIGSKGPTLCRNGIFTKTDPLEPAQRLETHDDVPSAGYI